jgi:Rieske Fe-S protein
MEKWRADFPIEWEEDRSVTRREFGKFLTLTSLALFAGNVWLLLKSWWRGEPAYTPKEICDISELPVGGVVQFQYPRPVNQAMLLRVSESKLLAYSQRCTHLSCAVYWEKKRGRLECPCHQGVFNLENGSVLGGPPTRPLPQIKLERRGTKIFAIGVSEA